MQASLVSLKTVPYNTPKCNLNGRHCVRLSQNRPISSSCQLRLFRNARQTNCECAHASSYQGETSTSSGLAPELKEAVEEFLTKNKVVLFMKGTKQFPQCGFSNTCVQILNITGVPYETVNILEDESLRQGMKEYSQWPTFPQLYIKSEFIGGCDILLESYQSGELQELLEVALNS